MIDISLEEARAFRDYGLQPHLTWYVAEDGRYVCRICGGVGPWGSEIAHKERQTDGGPVLCCVARHAPAVRSLIAKIQRAEPRSGDSPVVGGAGM